MSFRSSSRDLPIAALGRAISVVGDEVALVALLLWASTAGHGPVLVAALVLAAAVPQLLLAPVSGLAADRLAVRHLIVATALVQAALCVGLAFALPDGAVTTVVALVLLRAAGQSFLGPAWQTWLPSLVPGERLTAALSTVQTATATAALVGPVLGGVLVAASGARWALLLDGATFVLIAVAALAVAQVPERRSSSRGGEGREHGALTAGLRVVAADPVIRGFVVVVGTVVIALGALNVAEVFLVTQEIGAGPTEYGLVATVFAAGLMAGSWLARRVGGDRAAAVALVGGTLLMACAAVLLGLAPTVLVAAAAASLIGVGNGLLNVLGQVLMVRRAPREVLGRVVSVLQAVVGAGALVATAVGGLLLAVVDSRAVVVGSGIATALALLLVGPSLVRAASMASPAGQPAADDAAMEEERAAA
jgi:MFS family permease